MVRAVSLNTHLALLAFAVIGTLVMGFAFRRKQTWPAILLWLVPIVLAASLADLLLRGVALLWSGADGWLAWTVAYLFVLPFAEVAYQVTVTTFSGGGARYIERGDPAPQ